MTTTEKFFKMKIKKDKHQKKKEKRKRKKGWQVKQSSGTSEFLTLSRAGLLVTGHGPPAALRPDRLQCVLTDFEQNGCFVPGQAGAQLAFVEKSRVVHKQCTGTGG